VSLFVVVMFIIRIARLKRMFSRNQDEQCAKSIYNMEATKAQRHHPSLT
jgi:hypothetical protein